MPLAGALIGLGVSIAIISYTYHYAALHDSSITNFYYFLFQKQYRILQFAVSLFPVGIGYFLGSERSEKLKLKIIAQKNKKLYEQVVTSCEEERKRISRELHDGVAQNLSGIVLGINNLKNSKSINYSRDLEDLSDLTKETIIDLRRLVSDLKPSILDDLGLKSALEELLRIFENKQKINIISNLDFPEKLSSLIEITIYRVVQEALNNIKKHAEANEVMVKADLDELNINININIKDNGKGFNYKKAISKKQSFGLSGIIERVQSLEGVADINSGVGIGTTIKIQIPISYLEGE